MPIQTLIRQIQTMCADLVSLAGAPVSFSIPDLGPPPWKVKGVGMFKQMANAKRKNKAKHKKEKPTKKKGGHSLQ